ncbi:hypothetical protein D3C71_1677230 [compost metagenome]
MGRNYIPRHTDIENIAYILIEDQFRSNPGIHAAQYCCKRSGFVFCFLYALQQVPGGTMPFLESFMAVLK